MSQSIGSYRIGTNLNYGGPNAGILSEYSLIADLGRRLGISGRIGTDYSSKFRVGAGLSYSIISRNKIRGTLGLEYHNNSESVAWKNEEFAYHSIHLPILIDLRISNKISFNFGYILRSTKDPDFDFDYATVGLYYRIK